MKIVINKCYGGFSISREAAEFMASKGCKHAQEELTSYPTTWYGYGHVDGCPGYDRSNPFLVEAVETLKEKASGLSASLSVVEIPDGVDYYIDNYDGMESIHEQHQIWD